MKEGGWTLLLLGHAHASDLWKGSKYQLLGTKNEN
jgi:hypothetical protein